MGENIKMKLKTECENCGVEIEFTKKDLKDIIVYNKGDTFLETREESKGDIYNSYPKRFHDVKLKVIDKMETKGIRCPVCEEKIFINKTYHNSGCWLREYAGLKCEEIGIESSTEWYKK